jgi:ATP-dependent RNA helicase SUPV3L1/SUV3
MTTIKAILGPTNTGKTHYAIDRMLAHGTGMIGLPLRLLAREVYDRVVAEKGAALAALVTGEERICPDTARYFVCTVESMLAERKVDFVAIDEIQLAADEERGHVFTDRILNLRGHHETLLLGSDIMCGLLRELGIGAETEARERFSELRYIGHTKITKLPKRTAIVAFSSEEVYAIAELLKRQKGGAAVVMGALSPRTRNAQVALYQSGEVDYLVATDAIGMGLNLDVDRVVFASSSKFDGRRQRSLTPAECGQIAGRAGRFRTDGEFGETGSCPHFKEDVWKAIEAHTYDPVDAIQWRASDLDFASLRSLIRSLSRAPGKPCLIHTPDALDEWVLRRISEDARFGPDISGSRQVRRLWDLARLPDFRKAGPEAHGRLVLGLAETLADPDARLSDDGLRHRLEDLASTQGDIAQLQQRLASIRTWTYAAHRPDWLENPPYWQERTRQIEDTLSDALHQALTARFVDRRTTALLAGLRKEDTLVTEMSADGEVSVEGHVVGRLHGLKFEPVLVAQTLEGKTVRGAALAAVRPLLLVRLAELSSAHAAELNFSDEGEVVFRGAPVARLRPGASWLRPKPELIGAAEADPPERQPALDRVSQWLQEETSRLLPVHCALQGGDGMGQLEGMSRGIAYRLLETGAAIDLRRDRPPVHLSPDQREKLKLIGIRTGRLSAYLPDALKPAAQRFIALLKNVGEARPAVIPPIGAGSFLADAGWSDEGLLSTGYLRFGRRALRADLAERLGWRLATLRKEAGRNFFAVPMDLASVASCPAEEWPDVLRGFGLTPAERNNEAGEITAWRFAGRSPAGDRKALRPKSMPGKAAGAPAEPGKKVRPASRAPAAENSPFAALAVLLPPPPPARARQTGRKRQSAKPTKPSFTYRPFE